MSHERITIDPELSAIEAALGSLVPARSRIDRDLVMFRAGQAAARAPSRSRRAWIACAASLGLVALAEALLLAHRPPQPIVERVVVAREPAKPPVEVPHESAVAAKPAAPVSGSSANEFALGRTAYERLAEQVIRYGLDGLPAPAATAWAPAQPRPAATRQVLQEEIRRAFDPGDHS